MLFLAVAWPDLGTKIKMSLNETYIQQLFKNRNYRTINFKISLKLKYDKNDKKITKSFPKNSDITEGLVLRNLLQLQFIGVVFKR